MVWGNSSRAQDYGKPWVRARGKIIAGGMAMGTGSRAQDKSEDWGRDRDRSIAGGMARGTGRAGIGSMLRIRASSRAWGWIRAEALHAVVALGAKVRAGMRTRRTRDKGLNPCLAGVTSTSQGLARQGSLRR